LERAGLKPAPTFRFLYAYFAFFAVLPSFLVAALPR
jgi:hypothetical protein